MNRWLGILSMMGAVAGVLLFMAFANGGWGEPGTAVYQNYELLNRLNAFIFLFIAAGWLGAFMILEGNGRWAALVGFTGTLLYAVGTAAEFWLFSDLPYNPPNEGWTMRHTAFTTALVGNLVRDIGAMITGFYVWRSGRWLQWVAIILLLALPLDLFSFMGLGSTSLVSVLYGLVLGWILFKKEPVFSVQSL